MNKTIDKALQNAKIKLSMAKKKGNSHVDTEPNLQGVDHTASNISQSSSVIEEVSSIPLSVGDNNNLTMINLENVNGELDKVTEDPFVNSILFVNAVRGTLERFGIVLPPPVNMTMIELESEMVFEIPNTSHYVYMTHNLDLDGHVEGYAQIVTEDELNDLMDLDYDEDDDDVSPNMAPERRWIPPARRDDDSGNNNEY